jgi:hypothetical protein
VIDDIYGFRIAGFAFAPGNHPTNIVMDNPADDISSVTVLAKHHHLDISPTTLCSWSSHKYSGRLPVNNVALFVDTRALPVVDYGASGSLREGQRHLSRPPPQYDRPSLPPPPPPPIPIWPAYHVDIEISGVLSSFIVMDCCSDDVVMYSYVAPPIGEDVDSCYDRRINMSTISSARKVAHVALDGTAVTRNRLSAHHLLCKYATSRNGAMSHAIAQVIPSAVALSLTTLRSVPFDHLGVSSPIVEDACGYDQRIQMSLTHATVAEGRHSVTSNICAVAFDQCTVILEGTVLDSLRLTSILQSFAHSKVLHPNPPPGSNADECAAGRAASWPK